MLRTVLSVIAGYLSLAITAFLGVMLAWAVLGASAAFEEGSTTASVPWSLINCAFGLLAGVVGGWVASRIGKHPGNVPVKALSVLVLVLGLGLAVAQLGKEVEPLPAGKSSAELTFMEAGDVAISPDWYNFTIPFIGVAGVLVGGGLAKLD